MEYSQELLEATSTADLCGIMDLTAKSLDKIESDIKRTGIKSKYDSEQLTKQYFVVAIVKKEIENRVRKIFTF